jgi:hypothetical protein
MRSFECTDSKVNEAYFGPSFPGYFGLVFFELRLHLFRFDLEP